MTTAQTIDLITCILGFLLVTPPLVAAIDLIINHLKEIYR